MGAYSQKMHSGLAFTSSCKSGPREYIVRHHHMTLVETCFISLRSLLVLVQVCKKFRRIIDPLVTRCKPVLTSRKELTDFAHRFIRLTSLDTAICQGFTQDLGPAICYYLQHLTSLESVRLCQCPRDISQQVRLESSFLLCIEGYCLGQRSTS